MRLSGSNNNFFDVEGGILNQNQVQVIPTNSAGLQVVIQGSGVTEQDKNDIKNKVLNAPKSEHTGSGTIGEEIQSHATPADVKTQSGEALEDYDVPTKTEIGIVEAHIEVHRELVEPKIEDIHVVQRGRWKIENNQLIIFDVGDSQVLFKFNLFDKDGNPTTSGDVYERIPA